MKVLLLFAVSLLLTANCFAASPSFGSFYTNHFTTNGLVIKAKLNPTQFDTNSSSITITITNVAGAGGFVNPTDNYIPYRISGTNFGDSLLEYRGTNYTTLHGFGAGLFIGSHTEAWYGSGLTGEAIVAANIVADGDPDDMEMLITSVDGSNNGAFHVNGSSVSAEAQLSVNGASPSQLFLSSRNIYQRLDSVDFHINFDPFASVAARAPFYFNQDAVYAGTNALAMIDYRTNTQFRVNIASGYDGTGAKYLDSSGYYTVPGGGGGGAANWVAEGTTNSTLPGIGSAHTFVSTNAFYAGDSFLAWSPPSSDDTFIGIHDVALGASDYSILYVANVDDANSETNYADFTVRLETSGLSPTAYINLAAVATNDVSTFVVDLQPDQGVARIELLNRGEMRFSVADSSGYATNGHKVLTDDGTYKYLGSAAYIYTNIMAENLTGSADADIYTIPAGYRGVPTITTSSTNTSGTATVSVKVKIAGSYYLLVSGQAQTNAANAIATTFVFEPGDIVAANPSLTGVNVLVSLALIPETDPLRSERITSFIVGSNPVYTVPAGKVAINPLRSQLLSASITSISPLISQSSGGPLQYQGYLNAVRLADKSYATATPAILGVIGHMMEGDAYSITAPSTDATQFAWITVYEIDQ